MNDFDKIIECNLEDASIKMGFLKGNEKILFIKTGQGGSMYGYENKYRNIAHLANEKFGCTVFVSETSNDKREVYEKEMEIVERAFPDGSCEIYYLGVSKGGLIGIWYGADNAKVKRILSVNAPLMINFHNRTLPSLKKLTKNKVAMLYGTLDPSYRYIPFLQGYANVKTVEGADHNFEGKTNEFTDIAIEFLNCV